MKRTFSILAVLVALGACVALAKTDTPDEVCEQSLSAAAVAAQAFYLKAEGVPKPIHDLVASPLFLKMAQKRAVQSMIEKFRGSFRRGEDIAFDVEEGPISFYGSIVKSATTWTVLVAKLQVKDPVTGRYLEYGELPQGLDVAFGNWLTGLLLYVHERVAAAPESHEIRVIAANVKNPKLAEILKKFGFAGPDAAGSFNTWIQIPNS